MGLSSRGSCYRGLGPRPPRASQPRGRSLRAQAGAGEAGGPAAPPGPRSARPGFVLKPRRAGPAPGASARPCRQGGPQVQGSALSAGSPARVGVSWACRGCKSRLSRADGRPGRRRRSSAHGLSSRPAVPCKAQSAQGAEPGARAEAALWRRSWEWWQPRAPRARARLPVFRGGPRGSWGGRRGRRWTRRREQVRAGVAATAANAALLPPGGRCGQ